jgi:BirA family transcriptional regulator, biotin operon repressor / biotin---[acetyl-CoA-carboxylase] ligase
VPGATRRYRPYPAPVPAPTRTSELGRWRIEWFGELDSTNRYLLGAAGAGAADGLVAVADHQTAGRGRLDRRWDAPPGSSLLVSVLLRVPGEADASSALMAAGVALADAVESTAGVLVGLKWPNDLVVAHGAGADRKLAGLLAERDRDALVVGAGCNVNWESFPPALAETATACNLEAGHVVDRDALLDAYLTNLDRFLATPDDVMAAYRARLLTVGRRVRVEHPGGTISLGIAVEVAGDGALVVQDDDGREQRVTAADVVHLRPA